MRSHRYCWPEQHLNGGIHILIKDKVAIVTGAAQGIGRAIAQLFSENGAIVVLCDMQEDRVNDATRQIHSLTGFETMGIVLDVTIKPDVQLCMQKVLSAYGKIDILVNNAGILKHSLLLDMSEQDWDKVFAVNVKGTFLFTQAAGRVMKTQGSGKIVNMSSCSGKKPSMEEGAYCASKSAIIGLTRVTALELGQFGINCNAICPGATDTEMVRNTFLTSPAIEREWVEKTALKRLGTPQDMAKVALFLASSLSDHMTGESLIVSAGEIMGQ